MITAPYAAHTPAEIWWFWLGRKRKFRMKQREVAAAVIEASKNKKKTNKKSK